MSKAGICKEAAITASGSLPQSVIAYGLYIPTTPKETWEPEWQPLGTPAVFTHFWVETADQIVDTGAEQFGGPPEVTTTLDDPHYVKVGIFDKYQDRTIPIVNDPVIDWGTYDRGIKSIIRIHWSGMNEHLRKL